jgi:hypothetical protein
MSFGHEYYLEEATQHTQQSFTLTVRLHYHTQLEMILRKTGFSYRIKYALYRYTVQYSIFRFVDIVYL